MKKPLRVISRLAKAIWHRPGSMIDLPVWRAADLGEFGRGIECDLHGERLWFASPDTDVLPVAESTVCLLAPWCASRGITLRVQESLAPGFLANVHSATAMMGGWWKHRPLWYAGAPDPLPAPEAPASTGPLALFFSGGVDSFYSLIRNDEVKCLVFVVGFDIRVHDREAWEALRRSHQQVAQERGMRLITVFTNLREHCTLRGMNWERYHGAALAAVAHSLRAEAGRFMISASYQRSNLMPWGSHPDLDWRWSSDAMSLIHFGDDRWRTDKLIAMADHDVVHRHLHVCFIKPGAHGNCGCCEKCIRTRLIYHTLIPGVVCKRMPVEPGLAEAVDRLKRLKTPAIAQVYERFRDATGETDPVRAALERLLERARGRQP